MKWYLILAALAIGYLLGNANGAVIMSRLIAHEDVRTHGSGNAGMTNFMRNYGAAKGVPVILIDVSKAVLACVIGRLLFLGTGYEPEGTMFGAIGVSLGHDFPALLGFKGGKGVLCGITLVLICDWRIGLTAAGVFLVVVLLTDYVSLSSIAAALTCFAGFLWLQWGHPVVAFGGAFLSLLVICLHKANIERLLKGTESKAHFLGRDKEKK